MGILCVPREVCVPCEELVPREELVMKTPALVQSPRFRLHAVRPRSYPPVHTRPLHLERLESRAYLSVNFEILSDIHTTGKAQDVFPRLLTASGEFLYFYSGQALWRTDGTPHAEQLVQELPSNTRFNDFGPIHDVNGTVYFSTEDDQRRTLWRSDGTESGTEAVAEFQPGSIGGLQGANIAGTFFFSVADDEYGTELWVTDGTDLGTRKLTEFFPGAIIGSSPAWLTNVNGTLFFRSFGLGTGHELWSSDGTRAGTRIVKDIWPGPEPQLMGENFAMRNVAGTLYFSGINPEYGQELWKSDGTDLGTELVADLLPGPGGSYPSNLVDVNGTLFFTANDGVQGRELWMSDGSPAGTRRVKDIRSGPSSSNVTWVTNAGGTLFFTANDGRRGQELWRSDGTEIGTHLVREILPGADPGSRFDGPRDLTNVSGTLFFSAENATFQNQLWRSDGTAAGTVPVIPASHAGGLYPMELTAFKGRLYFRSWAESDRPVIWQSDGTSAGTFPSHDLVIGNGSAIAESLFVDAGGRGFFVANDGVHGGELWTTDGTADGTTLLKDIYYNAVPNQPSDIRQLVTVGDTAFFSANDGTNGHELWKSDGTSEGTLMVARLGSDDRGAIPFDLINVRGTLYFSTLATVDAQLWKSDGTRQGTVPIQSQSAGQLHRPRMLTNVNGTLFFAAADASLRPALWKTDGTNQGTQRLKFFQFGNSPRRGINQLTNVLGTLYFTANDGASGYELWKSDGTEAGTVLVRNLVAGSAPNWAFDGPLELTDADGTLFFTAEDPKHGRELWRSDGTPQGTFRVKDIRPGAADSLPRNLTPVGEKLYFTANDGSHGREIWITDGTEQGTRLVHDVQFGPRGSNPLDLTPIDSQLYFAAVTRKFGSELWSANPVTETVSQVFDFATGSLGGLPRSIRTLGSRIIVSATSSSAGRELWISDPSPASTVVPVGKHDEQISDQIFADSVHDLHDGAVEVDAFQAWIQVPVRRLRVSPGNLSTFKVS